MMTLVLVVLLAIVAVVVMNKVEEKEMDMTFGFVSIESAEGFVVGQQLVVCKGGLSTIVQTTITGISYHAEYGYSFTVEGKGLHAMLTLEQLTVWSKDNVDKAVFGYASTLVELAESGLTVAEHNEQYKARTKEYMGLSLFGSKQHYDTRTYERLIR